MLRVKGVKGGRWDGGGQGSRGWGSRVGMVG